MQASHTINLLILFFVILAKDHLGEIVGLHWMELNLFQETKIAKIISLWVNEIYRKNGIGLELKRRGEKWAIAQGANHILTHVFCANQKMIDYNKRLGYSPWKLEMVKKL